MNTNNNKLFLLLGLLAMTACSSDDAALDLQQPAEPGDYITLDVTAADDATRGAVITSSTIADLRLTGMKYLNTSNIDATSPADFFYNQEVTKASGWKTAFCWPGNKEKVQLFAFAPSAALAATDGGEGVTWSAEDRSGVPTLFYKQPTTIGNMQDLVVAHTAALAGNSTSAPLSFSHALAKVEVKISTTAGVQGCNVKSVKFRNIVGTGTMTFGGDWTLGSTTDVTVSGGTSGTATLFMLPQTLPSSAAMDVTIDYGSMEKTFTQSLSGHVWTKGQGRTYTITLNTRPKLPIEYVAPYNMASATTMATSNANNVSYYWTFDNAKNTFKNGVTIGGVKYHQPTEAELVSIFPRYNTGGQADQTTSTTETVKIGKATYNFNASYKGDGSTIIYGIKFISSDNRYRCAYRYSRVSNTPTGYKVNVRVRYIGSQGSVSINTVATENYWNSNNSNDIVREFPCAGTFPRKNQNYAVSSATSADYYGYNAFLWTSSEGSSSDFAICLTCHVISTPCWFGYDSGGDPTWKDSAFPVRLWSDE